MMPYSCFSLSTGNGEMGTAPVSLSRRPHIPALSLHLWFGDQPNVLTAQRKVKLLSRPDTTSVPMLNPWSMN